MFTLLFSFFLWGGVYFQEMLNDIYEILRKQITWLNEKRETMISQSTQRKLKREHVRHKKKSVM